MESPKQRMEPVQNLGLKRPKKLAGQGRNKIGTFKLLTLDQTIKDWLLKNSLKNLKTKLKAKS